MPTCCTLVTALMPETCSFALENVSERERVELKQQGGTLVPRSGGALKACFAETEKDEASAHSSR